MCVCHTRMLTAHLCNRSRRIKKEYTTKENVSVSRKLPCTLHDCSRLFGIIYNLVLRSYRSYNILKRYADELGNQSRPRTVYENTTVLGRFCVISRAPVGFPAVEMTAFQFTPSFS